MSSAILILLKKLSMKRMEISLLNVDRCDPEYNSAMVEVVRLSQEYQSMDLGSDKKETIDHLLMALDEAEVEQVNLAYLAGLADCLLILEALNLIEL